MDDPGHRLKFKFQAKVLLPVVVVLVVFMAATLWLFSTRIERQLRSDAELQRASLQSHFTNAVAAHADNVEAELASRLKREDFYDLGTKLQDANPDLQTFAPTMEQILRPMLDELGEDAQAVLYISSGQDRVVVPPGQMVAGTNRAGNLDLKRFYAAADASVKAVLDSRAPDVRSIELNNRLFDVVSVPSLNASNEVFFGVVCVGVEVGAHFARQSAPPHSQIAVIVNDRVAASTYPTSDSDAALLDRYHQLAGRSALPDLIQPIKEEHFVGLAGTFPRFVGEGRAGYLLLSSYEKSLQEFHDTQRVLGFGSLLGIIFGTAIVWLLVRRATQPLRQLRDSAEAVGRGDFSKRIEIASDDELGELATVFNQMTGNLQKSLTQLEKTVQELRNTQAQLMHSEKLSAVGEFVAGVAHELNNPLTVLIGYSELLQAGNVDAESRDTLKRISGSAERCHKIVQSLLGFARQYPPERKLTNLNSVVDAVLEILSYELRTSNITIAKDYAANLPRLMVDPHQLQQVFLNIVNNARQAMEAHQPKGSIRISTLTVGQRVQVRFQDDGPGISRENLAKIFNPFFTTKPVGKGTGLGLSLSYGIVQEHGGQIIAESEVGRGTTFIIDLPITTGAEEAPLEIAASAATPLNEGRGKKLLVVDDEHDILDLLGKTLQKHGYEVEKALDGEKALERLARQPFDLIISDWKMPGMNGQQLYERLLEINRPAADRMIFMTGDVLSEKIERYLHDHGKTCLSKPFSLVDFRVAVSKIFGKQ